MLLTDEACLAALAVPISAVILYRIDVTVARHYSYGDWNSRQHGILCLTSGEHSGWGEELMATNRTEIVPAEWGAPFSALTGLSVSDALDYVYGKRGEWPGRQCEMAEMTLLDLAGRVLGLPTTELLGLTGIVPVPGLFCILESDPERVRERARLAVSKGLTTHVKLKLYGKTDVDTAVVRAAREVLGSETYLVGDVNAGYRPVPSEEPLDEIVRAMGSLYDAGLTACEDPAKMSFAQWVELQTAVAPLALIPDEPLRPGAKALAEALPGMGRLYNIHPGCMASIRDGIALARRVQNEFHNGIMVGDNSLIGPGCMAWQQIAVGVGAAFTEALEKPDESSAFLSAIRSGATKLEDGKVSITERRPGFGLDVDTDTLAKNAANVTRIG